MNLQFTDGVKFVEECSDDAYDIVIVDSTDPISVGEGLFTTEFYQNCKRILKVDGILVNQSETPYVGQDMVLSINKKLKAIFPNVHHYMGVIPTYPGALWLFGFASKKLNPIDDMHEKCWNALGLTTKYYNTDIHRACFTLPNFVRDMLK